MNQTEILQSQQWAQPHRAKIEQQGIEQQGIGQQRIKQPVHKRMDQLQGSLILSRVLKQVTDQIRSTLDLQEILKTIVCEVRTLLYTDRVVLYQFDSDWHGRVVVEDVGSEWMPIVGASYADKCFSEDYAIQYWEGRVRAINDVQASNLHDCHKAFLNNMQVQANLVVPIRQSKRLWGLLIAHACEAPRVWQAFEIDLLQQLADQAAIALHQAELYEQSQTAAELARAKAEQLEQALQTLKQTQAQLVQTEKMSSLGQLVAGVAHEINNPVNFIHGNLIHTQQYIQELLHLIQLYQHHYPQPVPAIHEQINRMDLTFLVADFFSMLSSMQNGTERIRQIVLSLRNFSRLEQAEMKLVDLHEGLDSTLMILQHRLKPKPDGFTIELIKDYGKLPLVECFAGQLNQVFMNLLSNAIDALEEDHHQHPLKHVNTNPGKIIIHTALLSGSPDGDSPDDSPTRDQHPDSTKPVPRVLLRITDNGLGMTEALQAKIFDPFFTTKPTGQGTGLGLSISYQIVVEKHQGTFQCISRPGEGTEFRIELPIEQSY